MKVCKIIGGIVAFTGAIIGLVGIIQKEAWAAGGPVLILIGRLISEQFPEWFDL